MKTARRCEGSMDVLEGEKDELNNFDLFLVPPPPELTTPAVAPPPLPPRPTNTTPGTITTTNTRRSSGTSSATGASGASRSVAVVPRSTKPLPFSARPVNTSIITTTTTTTTTTSKANSSTAGSSVAGVAAAAAVASPSPPPSAASSCSKIQQPLLITAPVPASAPSAERSRPGASSGPPETSLPANHSPGGSGMVSGHPHRSNGAGAGGISDSGCSGVSGGGGAGNSSCGGSREVVGAPKPSPAPVAAPAPVPLAVREAVWGAPSATAEAFQPTEPTPSISSAKASASNGRRGSWNWGKLGRSVVGTVLGPAAVGRVSDGGGGEGKKGVGCGTPARQLSEPEVQQMENGKVNVSVWRNNKQDLNPVKVQVGLFDSAYEGQRAAEAFCPPKWQEVTKDSRCAVCESTFGFVYSRRHHCRNCGRLVCSSCAETSWPRSMLPSTYRVDTSEKKVRVCNTCHGASENFRKALLSGSEEEAMAAYSTGCVNLRAPYTIYHSELPVHCAAAGGNLNIMIWLVEDRCCPLFCYGSREIALGDSRKRSVMAAAAASGQIHIMRYLAFTQGCKVTEIKDMKALWCALDKCIFEGNDVTPSEADSGPSRRHTIGSSSSVPEDGSCGGGGGGGDGGGGGGGTYPSAPPMPESGFLSGAEVASAENDADKCCIVCFERKVDCTLVPCGHHCCCLECAAQFEQCPVCRADVKQKIKAISV